MLTLILDHVGSRTWEIDFPSISYNTKWFFSADLAKNLKAYPSLKPTVCPLKITIFSESMIHFPDESAVLPSLKLTASLHLKIDGWNTILPFGFGPIFRGKLAVSFLWSVCFFLATLRRHVFDLFQTQTDPYPP